MSISAAACGPWFLAHEAGRTRTAARAGWQGVHGVGPGRRRVERQLGKLGTVVDLEAVGGAGARAQRAGVAAQGAVAAADQVEQTPAAGLAEQLALLEVDAFDDLVEAGALGSAVLGLPLRLIAMVTPRPCASSGSAPGVDLLGRGRLAQRGERFADVVGEDVATAEPVDEGSTFGRGSQS